MAEKRINCQIILDQTESNIEELKKIADFIICTPGLQKQFYLSDYDKRKVIYLTSLEYHCNDTDRVI